MNKVENSKTKKYDAIPDVELTEKEEAYLEKKFDKYAKVLQWVGADSTYYIHVGGAIVKHTDTRCLFNLMAAAYKKDKTIVIW